MISINKDLRDVPFHDNTPKFLPGQLVRHCRYGYRGVVVDFNAHCTADPEWYMSNKTQPERDQPWYHVLVHNSASITYAAESSLQADDSEELVNHALVEHFFTALVNGRYIRNEEPWPE